MGNITWSKSWSASDNGTIFGGVDLQNIQNDITTVVNGGITNSNVNASAAIVESKITFHTTTGHDHDGTDSKLPMIKHYIKGGRLTRASASTITVGPTTIEIGGDTLISTTTSAAIDVSSDASYITPSGGAAGNEPPANNPVYVYAYNNSGTLAFKLGDENAAPTLSYDDATTAEYPLRYIKDSGNVYYRCIGLIENGESQNLEADGIVHLDSNIICGSFVSSNADWSIHTIWTPRYIKIWNPADTAPDDGDAFTLFETFEYGEKTADPHLGGDSATAEVTFMHVGATHNLEAEATAGNIKGITQQAVATSGGFTIHAPTDNIAVYYMAMTDRM
jgi:hypothetical protein